MIWFIVFNATFSNISALSWRPDWVVEEAGENHQTTDQRTIFHGENMLHFDEKWWWCPLYTRLCTCFLSWTFFYSASSLKQQFVCRHVVPLRHIILIPSQPVFVFAPQCCVLSEYLTNTNFIVWLKGSKELKKIGNSVM
jgi:hypothetical protein